MKKRNPYKLSIEIIFTKEKLFIFKMMRILIKFKNLFNAIVLRILKLNIHFYKKLVVEIFLLYINAKRVINILLQKL